MKVKNNFGGYSQNIQIIILINVLKLLFHIIFKIKDWKPIQPESEKPLIILIT